MAFGTRNQFFFLTVGFYLATGKISPWPPRKNLSNTAALALAQRLLCHIGASLSRGPSFFLVVLVLFYSLEYDYSEPL